MRTIIARTAIGTVMLASITGTILAIGLATGYVRVYDGTNGGIVIGTARHYIGVEFYGNPGVFTAEND